MAKPIKFVPAAPRDFRPIGRLERRRFRGDIRSVIATLDGAVDDTLGDGVPDAADAEELWWSIDDAIDQLQAIKKAVQ